MQFPFERGIDWHSLHLHVDILSLQFVIFAFFVFCSNTNDHFSLYQNVLNRLIMELRECCFPLGKGRA